MKILMLLLAIGLTTADKLDRTYLPPPGSKYSGGQSGDLQTPLEYNNGFTTTGRPQGTLGPTFPSSTSRPVSPIYQGLFSSSTVAPQNLNTFTPGIPTTTTSYAFTQTTTYSPIDDKNLPANQGQTLVDQNGNRVLSNFFKPGTFNQRPGFDDQLDTVKYDQNGKVVSQTTYDKNGNVVPQVTFDRNGNIVPQTVYNKDGQVVPQTVYDKNGNIVPQNIYDKNGNIIPRVTYDRDGNVVPNTVYDKNGNIVPQTVYDKNGNVVPQVTYDRDRNIIPKVVYDQNGNMAPQVTYNRDGNVVPNTVYDNNGYIVPQIVYNKNGNVIPRVTYDRDGNVVPNTVYDKNGNIVPQTVYDKNENVVPQVTYDRDGNIIPKIVYDQNGNIVPQTAYDQSGNLVPQNFDDKNGNFIPQVTYDANGNVIPKVVYDKNGNTIPQTVYDKNGNVVHQVTYDRNGNVLPKTVYDKNGNIVPQTVFDHTGKVIPKIVYDKNGNIVPQVTYDQNGNIIPQAIYDKNGNKLPSFNGIKTPIVRPERPQAESDRTAVILNFENILTPEGFAYSFDTSNGIHADESGTAVDGVKAQGGYSYVGDDGKTYSVIYSADENGFLPRGDHLPTPPPIPEAILRVIEDAKKGKEAGIIEDGSYDDNKYGYKKYQGPMDRYRPSNRKQIFGPDGKPIRRPISSIVKDNDDTVDYIGEDVNNTGDVSSGNKKLSGLPSRRPIYNGQTNEYNNNVNKNDDSTLTVGNQRVARPQSINDKNKKNTSQVAYDGNVPKITYDGNGNIVPQTVYDKNGNVAPQVTYDRNGNIVPKIIYNKNDNIEPQTVYNKNGNIIPRVTYDRDGNVVPNNVYDQNGNIVPQTVYDKNGNVVPQITYDQDGNIVPNNIYDNNGNVLPQTTYDKKGNVLPQVTYDRYGNVLPQNVYDKNGEIVPQTIYDENGNVIPQVTYDQDGNIVPKIVYDKSGNIVSQTIYDKKGNVIPQVTYDRYGNVLPQNVYDKNGEIIPQTIYDENGNVIPQVTYDRDGNIVPKIIYDKNGNIVPQTVYDKKGNIIPHVTYDRDGTVVPKIVYDKNRNIVENNRIPEQRGDQDYKIVKNPDGSEALIPINKQSVTHLRPNQFSSPDKDNKDFLTVKDGQRFNVDDAVKDGNRPTSTYKGYEYIVPVKTFEVGQNTRGDISSTAKPFITQPDDIDSFAQKNDDRRISSQPSNRDSKPGRVKFPHQYKNQSTIRPISSLRDNAPITVNNQPSLSTGAVPSGTSTLSPEYITTYRPGSSSGSTYDNKVFPGTISGGTSSTPATFLPSSENVLPSTTYRPTYNNIKGSQGEKILANEFSRPGIKSTPSPFTPSQGTYNPTSSVTQKIPIIDTNRPVQTQFALPGSTVSPGQTYGSQNVDGFGRPVEETLVDGNGSPIISIPGQRDQITGRPVYTLGPVSRITSPGYTVDAYGRPVQNVGNLPSNVTPGRQQQRITIDRFGKPVVTNGGTITSGSPQNIVGSTPGTEIYENQPNQVIGEDFSGPKQQQKYDSKTGYYY